MLLRRNERNSNCYQRFHRGIPLKEHGTGVRPPQKRTWDQKPDKEPGTGIPLPLERTWDQKRGKGPGTGVPLSPINRQVPVKTLPSRRTPYTDVLIVTSYLTPNVQ